MISKEKITQFRSFTCWNSRNESKNLAVDSIKPMGALYLTIKLDYVGKTTEDGKVLKDSTDLVFYLIEKGVALVPFSAFGNSREMPWFRHQLALVL